MDEDGRIRVLVVEDNPTQSNMLRMSLTRRGFEVECAPTMAEALEILANGGIEVILLDLSLPDSDGIQTFHTMYANAAQIPIVVLTGLNDQRIAYEALKTGAQDYLVKGIPSDESVVRCLRYAIQRQQFETELWESERRTRLILENAHDAFFSIDEAGEVTAWNAQAETIFGYMRKDALGKPLVALVIPPLHRKEFNQEIKLFMQGQPSTIVNTRTEITMMHQDMHQFPAEIALFPIAEGGHYRFCAFVRDISYRKQMDERLKQQMEQRLLDRVSELELVNKQLQKYMKTLVSDLQKPIDVIHMHAAVLNIKLGQYPDRQCQEYIRIVYHNAEKLVRTVDQLSGTNEPVRPKDMFDTWHSIPQYDGSGSA